MKKFEPEGDNFSIHNVFKWYGTICAELYYSATVKEFTRYTMAFGFLKIAPIDKCRHPLPQFQGNFSAVSEKFAKKSKNYESERYCSGEALY